MISEPAQPVLQRVDLARSEEQVITGLTIETAAAGAAMRARLGEVHRVDSGVLASAPIGTGPCWADSRRAKATAWRGLTMPQLTPGGHGRKQRSGRAPPWWSRPAKSARATARPRGSRHGAEPGRGQQWRPRGSGPDGLRRPAA